MNQKQSFNLALAKHSKDFDNQDHELHGQSLPCSVVAIDGNRTIEVGQKVNCSIVTVKFEIDGVSLPEVTMPVALSAYFHPSIAIGDKGVARKSSVTLNGINGLGGGIANLAVTSNLDGMVFEPIGNNNFDKTRSDMLTALKPISDNAFNFTATLLHDKSALIISKINEIIGVVNGHVGSSIALLPDDANLTEAD